MKKTTILSVMALLWYFTSKDKRARIQDHGEKSKDKRPTPQKYLLIALVFGLNIGQLAAQDNKAVDVTLNDIQIGQKVPDLTITGLHNYKDANGKNATTAKISDFKGKLLILDFWATWCSPCVAMIPRMDSLQKSFGDKIKFLSVTYQSEQEVLPFLKQFEQHQKKQYDLSVLTGSKELHQIFPHVYLPHYVWIGGDGMVKAISEMSFVSEKYIAAAVRGEFGGIVSKIDPKILGKEISKIDNVKKLFSSQLSAYTEGLTSGSEFYLPDSSNGKRVELRNVPLLWFYQRAFRNEGYFNESNTLITVKEEEKITSKKTIGASYREWLRNGNGWCYQVTTPLDADIFAVMQSDFANYFKAYRARIELRETKCLALERISTEDKLKTKGGEVKTEFSIFGVELENVPLKALINQLNASYLQKLGMPIIDDTGYVGNIDLRLYGNTASVDELNKSLAFYDLKFIPRVKLNKVLIIEDNPNFLKR